MAMSPEATKALIFEVLQRVLRSWWTVIAGLSLGLGGASVALLHIPKVYEANCTIFVAPPRLPGMQTMIVDDTQQRLAALREEVLSRPNMRTLIEELALNVPSFEAPQDRREMRRTVNRMRRSLKTKVRARGRLFSLTFHHEDPIVAAAVVNTLSQLYIEKNVTYRVGEVEKTREQYQALADRKRAELTDRRKVVTAFRERNINTLQESNTRNVQLLNAGQRELDNIQVQLERAGETVEQLRIQRDQTVDNAAIIAGSATDEVAQQLSRLRADLDELKRRYSPEYPAVRKKQRELDDFLAEYTASVTPDGGGARTSLSPFDAQIVAQENEIERLRRRRDEVEADIRQYQAWIDQTPRTMLRYGELTEGMDDLAKEVSGYERLASKAEDADMLEQARQGEQFQVIEPAGVPRAPISPKPFLIYAIGITLGVGVFVGPIVLRRVLVPVIASEATLRGLSENPMVFSIPRIPTATGMRREYWRRIRNMALAAASLVVLAASLAYAYTDGRLVQKLIDLNPMG